MAFPNYYHDYPPAQPPNPNYGRERYNTGASGASAGGTAVPPSAGQSPPPRAPVSRPHTTQPQGGYGYGPPPPGAHGYPGQRGSMYGGYAAYPPPYGGYPPPVSYAESLPPPPLLGSPLPPKSPQPPPGEGDGEGRSEEKSDKPPATGPLSNAAAVAQAEAAAPGIGKDLPDFKGWPPEERDHLIKDLLDRLAPKYPMYPPPPHMGAPPPPHYPPNPYYPHPQYYPPPHGYPPHMPPQHEAYNYPPRPPPLNSGGGPERERERRTDGEDSDDKEGAQAGPNGAAPIMPGGFASSPSAETPPPPPLPPAKHSRPSTPPKPAGTPPSLLKKPEGETRGGSMPPPRTRKTPAPEESLGTNPNRMPSTRKDQKEPDPPRTAVLGPNGQGDKGMWGEMWGAYLFDHTNQKKGSPPAPRPKLKSLLRGIAQWIIKDIEPKDSLVIPPDKLIKFYQSSKVEDEPFNWQAFITSIAPHNLSELFQQLECHHFLVPPPPQRNENGTESSSYAPFDPTIPALTPAGFEHWMVIQMAAFPDREARRLQRIITEFPIHDGEKNERFPKVLPRDCLPLKGDGLVENWWDEAIMSVRRGGYISNGIDDGPDFGYGPNSELIRGRERRPYAKSNVASSRGSSQEREQEEEAFVPPALTRKKTDQKYASTKIPFDDLREDPNKTAEIERKRKPYVSIFPPNRGARDVVYPPGGGGGTPINQSSGSSRPGGLGERPGSHDTSGSSGSGGYVSTPYSPTPSNSNTHVSTASSSRPGGGGVELHSGNSIAGSTATAKGGDYGVKMTPESLKHGHGGRAEEIYKRFGSASTGPTTPGSAHPSNNPSAFSSPNSRNAAAAGGQFTPISPASGGGAYPELHHYPSQYPHVRGSRISNILPPDLSPPEPRPSRRRASMSASDAAAEYFGGALPAGGSTNTAAAAAPYGGREYENDRLEYHPRGGHHHAAHGGSHGYPPSGYYRRERDSAWGDDDEEMYYRGGAPPPGGERERERERERREGAYRGRRGDAEQEEEVVPRRRTARSRPPSEFRDAPPWR